MSTIEESNARHAEYRARERRNNIAMMAKRMMVLRIGHVVGLVKMNDPDNYRMMSRQALAAAEAFYQELDAFDAALAKKEA